MTDPVYFPTTPDDEAQVRTLHEGMYQEIFDNLNAGKAEDSLTVHNTGNETIAGIKTFSSSPIVPIPTTSGQASTKGYVDITVGGVVLGQIPDGTVTPSKLSFDPATQAELDSHMADNVKHIASSERQAWNNISRIQTMGGMF